ncbi:hypothetical protein M404DRAFT_825563 [Pisolithus tinctorius Marx 270]|uniref:Uncharacterized protein n=1 Tax=Pisolithus tinctorius Marx 270 TaxID=870435 RepID=A0A0C3JMY1_PISTI|nr:hypothetical protein M404DRAFT_825563 [Pisolithus tinctorius Marx 270]
MHPLQVLAHPHPRNLFLCQAEIGLLYDLPHPSSVATQLITLRLGYHRDKCFPRQIYYTVSSERVPKVDQEIDVWVPVEPGFASKAILTTDTEVSVAPKNASTCKGCRTPGI